MQPRRLSRAAGKLCRKHAWNARSKQRHVPDAKQVLLWKGWVLKQRRNDVQSRVGATVTRAHVESPPRTVFLDSCSVRHRGNCCASTREIPATWISIRTQGTERCSCDRTAGARKPQAHLDLSSCATRHVPVKLNCCILTPRAHLDLFPCANRHVHATTLLHSHAVSTLGSLSVRNETCSGEIKLLHSHAASTLRSLSVRKQTCSCDNTSAFARCERTWISLRAQRGMFHRKDCCVLTPRAHLHLAPCAKKHVPPRAHLDLSPCASRKTCSCDRLLRSHATITLGSLSVHKETYVPEERLLRSRAAPQDR